MKCAVCGHDYERIWIPRFQAAFDLCPNFLRDDHQNRGGEQAVKEKQ